MPLYGVSIADIAKNTIMSAPPPSDLCIVSDLSEFSQKDVNLGC